MPCYFTALCPEPAPPASAVLPCPKTVMDIVGFTAMSKEVPPDDVINLLNALFIQFDALCDMHRVQKVSAGGGAAEGECRR